MTGIISFTGDFLHTRVGIENPTDGFNAIHDLSNQYHGLLHLTYTADADTRISLIAGTSNAQFQIPNNPGQSPDLGLSVNGISTYDSTGLTEHQREITDFTILSLQRQIGDIDLQTALFSRYSSLYFTPDRCWAICCSTVLRRRPENRCGPAVCRRMRAGR